MTTEIDHSVAETTRRRWVVKGQVQGVGFRPFVFRVANEFLLRGFVKNGTNGVTIECQGSPVALDAFAARLRQTAPPLVKITSIDCITIPPIADDLPFHIDASDGAELDHAIDADVTIDTAICVACLNDIRNAANRRHGYGLTNCTDCGPRYTIVRAVPYDRANTTMSGFGMCDACAAEYASPRDRRFHAQPISCHRCGPKVSLARADGTAIDGDPIVHAAGILRKGGIVAIKGLGGFHLAARADDAAAVRRLRDVKHRDAKPFALMCATIDDAKRIINLGGQAERLMQSPACPIILAVRWQGTAVAPEVAPGNHRLGVMLPYTPLHHLLFDALSGDGDGRVSALVMTSANVSDEPLVIDNADAVQRLAGMCDAILWHDRPIQRGVDDSIFIDMGEATPLPIRRARGYVPAPIDLAAAIETCVGAASAAAPPGLCVGGELKSTVAVVRDGYAILSHHLGDLANARAFAAFRQSIADLQQLLHVRPEWIAHDLHPAYLSTAHARRLAAEMNVPLIAVQHHHAHAASVMIEHGVAGPVLALVCDGTGYGADGTIWGGELLHADLNSFTRLARLRPLALCGGDAAARDTRRSAMSLLYQAFGADFAEHPAAQRIIPDADERLMIVRMLKGNVACVPSSGAGRLFDGIASLLGLCHKNRHEAQAAMALESAAAAGDDGAALNGGADYFEIRGQGPAEIDFGALVREILQRLAQGTEIAVLAGLFHEQFVRAWVRLITEFADITGLSTVALSGGVFCNERLTRRFTSLLESRGFKVLRHGRVPPNDGGLALGQAAVACSRLSNGLLLKDGH